MNHIRTHTNAYTRGQTYRIHKHTCTHVHLDADRVGFVQLIRWFDDVNNLKGVWSTLGDGGRFVQNWLNSYVHNSILKRAKNEINTQRKAQEGHTGQVEGCVVLGSTLEQPAGKGGRAANKSVIS